MSKFDKTVVISWIVAIILITINIVLIFIPIDRTAETCIGIASIIIILLMIVFVGLNSGK